MCVIKINVREARVDNVKSSHVGDCQAIVSTLGRNLQHSCNSQARGLYFWACLVSILGATVENHPYCTISEFTRL